MRSGVLVAVGGELDSGDVSFTTHTCMICNRDNKSCESSVVEDAQGLYPLGAILHSVSSCVVAAGGARRGLSSVCGVRAEERKQEGLIIGL